MAKPKAGARLGTWTLQADPETGGALKRGATELWWAVDDSGQAGALKYCADPAKSATGKKASYSRQRFVLEFSLMAKLTAISGVLPVLGLDPTGHEEWFVTQKSTLLEQYFGTEPPLWTVVEAFTNLSTTLASLIETHDITHRDVKPGNLFWLEGAALLGDFGIAHHAPNAGLTTAGKKAGPWGFIAPEALANHHVSDWRPADVYSLAKCLWKFATGQPFPPQGTLYVFEEQNSLYPFGGTAALELARLLEACTAHRPPERPLMRDLRDELSCWLQDNPAATIEKPADSKFKGFLDRSFVMRKASRSGFDAIAADCVRGLLNPLRDCRTGTSGVGEASPADLQAEQQIIDLITHGDPDWSPEFDATMELAWTDHPNTRVILQGIGEGDDATYFGQWQVRPDQHSPWRPGSPMRHTSGRLWFPSDFSTRAALSQQLESDGKSLPSHP